MAVCKECEQEMQQADSCTYDLILIKGGEYERCREHFDEPTGRCHDCGIKHGGTHHFGCDVERCPKCGQQVISCGCMGQTAILAKRPKRIRRFTFRG